MAEQKALIETTPIIPSNSFIAFICSSVKFLATLHIALQLECEAQSFGFEFLYFLHSFIMSQNVCWSECDKSIAIPVCINLCINSLPNDLNPFFLLIILHGLTPVPNLLWLFQTGLTVLTPRVYNISISSSFSK